MVITTCQTEVMTVTSGGVLDTLMTNRYGNTTINVFPNKI